MQAQSLSLNLLQSFNYIDMNFLRIADGTAGLFPKKQKIVLVRAFSDEKIGEYKIGEEQLPGEFNKPTCVEIGGFNWRIIKANVVREASYFFSKKLVLHVEEAEVFSVSGKYTVPTKSIENAEFVNENAEPVLINIPSEEWRQIEFLPAEKIDQIQYSLDNIKRILDMAEEGNALLGYDEVYLRSEQFNNSLQLPFDEFVEMVEAVNVGYVSFGRNGIVKKGFALESRQNIYYGICENDIIVELGVQNFESIDDEIIRITTRYGLVFVDWCSARIFMDTPPDAPEKDIIKF